MLKNAIGHVCASFCDKPICGAHKHDVGDYDDGVYCINCINCHSCNEKGQCFCLGLTMYDCIECNKPTCLLCMAEKCYPNKNKKRTITLKDYTIDISIGYIDQEEKGKYITGAKHSTKPLLECLLRNITQVSYMC